MRIPHVEDLFADECAVNFREEVHRLVLATPEAYRGFKYRGQLWDAADDVASDIAEGFDRHNPGENVNFLRYALASLAEARTRLEGGITRGFFEETDCKLAFTWADRTKDVTVKLLESQKRERDRRKRKRKRP